MQRSLPRLRDVGHRAARAARRARRPQAGAPPGALRDVRRRLPAGPRLLQVLPRRRRRDGPVPPARRHRDLRHPGAARPAVVAALPAGAEPGQLRLARRRPAAAMRYTECRLAPLAMEMVRDIDQETVDFAPNYDGRQQEPSVLPARFPNLLVNGSGGIAVGMATNIPPHNLREVASGVQWHLDHPEATHEELLAALLERIKGPDFPTKGLIVGTHGIRDAYTHRPRLGHDARGRRGRGGQPRPHHPGHHRAALPGQPGRAGPQDRRARRQRQGRTASPTCATTRRPRTGMRLVVVLKRDAVASVVRNNLYKHTQLQDTFGCNMLALVDGVPRTLALDAFIRHWIDAPDRGHRPAHPLPAAQGRGARAHPARAAQGARPHRRGHRADPGQRDRRGGARRADRAARDRRDPGRRDPQHAAAPARRPGAAGDPRPLRRR